MAHPPAWSPENIPPNVPAVFETNLPSVFETSRLRLRPWRDTDAPGPGEGPDEASLRFMPAGAEPGPDDFPAWLARRRADMEDGDALHWCIADAATDVMLGNVQIFRMGRASEVSSVTDVTDVTDVTAVTDRFQGELGYWLRPGARGRGVIGEAVGPVIAHAFTPVERGGLGLIRLHAATDSDNDASQSILRSAGFTQWGADHKAWRRADGSLSDGVYFELLASEPLVSEPLHSEPLHSEPLISEPLVSEPLGGGVGDGSPKPEATASAGVEPVTIENNLAAAGGAPRVRLRKWRHGDAARVVQACSDERTQHWLAHSLPSPYTDGDAHSYISGRDLEAREGKALSWCVADVETDVCVGSVAVMDLHHAMSTSGEIGYWVHPDARGRGLMSEAVRLAVRHAFVPPEDGGLGRHRLQLIAADGNEASQHIARVNGFVEVGRDRQAERLADGTFADLVRYDLLVDEWNTRG